MKYLALSLLLVGHVPIATATIWEKQSLRDLIIENSVIVVGRISKIKEINRKNEAIDIAYINVEQILKDNRGLRHPLPLSIPLEMPSTRDETMSTSDVTHSLGDRGIWFLKPIDDKYTTRFPDELQSDKLLPKIKKLLNKTEQDAAANP